MSTFTYVNVKGLTSYTVPGMKNINVVLSNFTASQTLNLYLPLATPVSNGAIVTILCNDTTFNVNTATLNILPQLNQTIDQFQSFPGNTPVLTFIGDGSRRSFQIAQGQSGWLQFYCDGKQWISNQVDPQFDFYYTTQVIPWTAWNYFVMSGSLGGDFYWNTSDSQNGSGFTGTPNRDYGTAKFNAPVSGTYRFTFTFLTGDYGIATFTINSVATAIDCYGGGGNNATSYTWTQVLSAGDYTIDLSTLTKNVSSPNYWLVPLFSGFLIQLT